MLFAPQGTVRLGGVLGDALEASRTGRLSKFITDEHSPAIALWSPDAVAANEEGDWYGEHAGKWLVAAVRAAVRSNDAALHERVRRVADWLIERQSPDGYLGTYAPSARFMVPQAGKPVTWDGAPARRTWDIWTHSYLILGLVELWKASGELRYLTAASRIGDLAWRTIGENGISITDLGNHFGLSATVLIDPAVELHLATGEQRYLDLAERILEQAEREPRNRFLSMALAGADPSEIATGKAYQLLWNLVGLAKLHRVTGEARYLTAVRNIWRAVREHHLTLGGGPWGGVAHRSREVFNPAGFFSPEAYVETCSTMAWIQVNRELLAILGEAAFAQEIERSAYNDLLAAQSPNGEDWCYYVFPNGRRTHTTYWRCCKSSGAMALEELPPIAYGLTQDGAFAVNLLGPSEARLDVPSIGTVHLRQHGHYPFEGPITFVVQPTEAATFPIDIRIPDWGSGARLTVGEEEIETSPGGYARIERTWEPGTVIKLDLPMPPRLHRAVNRNVQESFAPGGEPVAQEVLRADYLAVTRGPLVYATGPIDGYKLADTVRGEPTVTPEGDRVMLGFAGRTPITLEPYYRANGNRDRSWHITWLRLAEEEPECAS